MSAEASFRLPKKPITNLNAIRTDIGAAFITTNQAAHFSFIPLAPFAQIFSPLLAPAALCCLQLTMLVP